MEVRSPPRGKGGLFTKKRVSLMSSPLLELAAVALATDALAKKAELARVKPLRGCWGEFGAGYEERWPQTWEAELKAKVAQKLVCITEVKRPTIFSKNENISTPPPSI